MVLKTLDYIYVHGASLVAQMAKNMLAMQDTWVSSLGQEDPLEKGMATHSSILAWRIPWTEKTGGLHSMGLQSWTRLRDEHFHFSMGSRKSEKHLAHVDLFLCLKARV